MMSLFKICMPTNVSYEDFSRAVAVFSLFILTFLVGACSNNLVKQPNISKVTPSTGLPGQSFNDANPSYIIRSGDELDIKFFYNPALNETVTVRPDGRISLQLVHDVPASGITPDELVRILSEKYSKYLNTAEISVIVKSFKSQRIYVDGEVKNPGMVDLSGHMNLLQAVASAGGLKDSAKDNQILIIRQNGLSHPLILTADMGKIRSGEDIAQNIILKPYDIIYVPKSAIAQVNTWVDLYLRRNIPIDFSAGVYRSLD